MTRSNTIFLPAAVAAAAILGVIAARSIPSSVFPELVFPRAIILADSGDLAREQMLLAVTRPLEEAAYGVAGTRLVRSTTTRGSSEIDVTFGEATDPTAAFQLLNAAIADVRARLPAATSVDSRLLTSGAFPILDLSLSSPIRSLSELTDIAYYDLVPALHRIPGVYRVELVGGKYREYVVRLDPARMLAHQLSPQQVVAGLAAANVIASAGRVIDSHRMLLTVVSSDLHLADQLEAVPLTSLDGHPVLVRDIGTVELGIREDYIRAASERGPSVLIGISRQPAGSTELIAAQARSVVDDARRRYPDVNFSFSYDQAELVSESFRSVRDAILLGLLLAAVVVWLFTKSPLNALIAALVVPATIAMTCALMKPLGLTFNMMTLGGLAAGIGLFIDDAVVMVEAIHRERTAGASARDSIAAALKLLVRPLIASTLTVIIVFVPLVFLSGVTGSFFRALAITLGGGLAISLLLAIYFTPALELTIARLRRTSRPPGRIFALLRRAYLGALAPFVRFPAFSIAFAAAAVGLAVLLYAAIGTDYLPPMDEGAFILDYITPPQSTLADTGALLGKIEDVLRATPEVAAFSVRTGAQLGFFLTESNRGDISVRLRPGRNRPIDEIIDSVRTRILSSVPNVRIEFSQLLEDLIGDLSGAPEPVEVKVFGGDQAVLEATANRIADALRNIRGLVDISNGIVLSNPEVEIVVDGSAAQRYGLFADDVRASLDAAIQGTIATSVRNGDRLFGVRVRYPDGFHRDLAGLSEVLLATPANGRVPLSSVASVRWLGVRSELDRERLKPVIHVTARLSGIDLGSAVAQVRKRLAAIALPAGVTIELGGLYAQQQQAFRELTLVLIAGAVAVFLILLWEFARLTPALAVLISALTALTGSLIALYLIGITLNISSFMGIIMVVGITAKNGILLLDHAERELSAGDSPRAALIAAADSRLRPIVMTTIATAAGLLPLALGVGAGAKVQQPLAVAVIGGLAFALMFATPLTGGLYLLGSPRKSRRQN